MVGGVYLLSSMATRSPLWTAASRVYWKGQIERVERGKYEGTRRIMKGGGGEGGNNEGMRMNERNMKECGGKNGGGNKGIQI